MAAFSVTSAAYYVTVILLFMLPLRRSLSRREDGHFQRR